APRRFSTRNGRPSTAVRRSAVMRVARSVLPPAPKGTMSRTGRFGQACASAPVAATSNRSAAACFISIDAREGVAARDVCRVGDRVVAVDERPAEEAVLHAAHLVLDLEQLPRVARIDDPLEAPLGLVGVHGDELALQQPLVRRGKVRDVDLEVMVVVLGDWGSGFGEIKVLVA